MIINIHSAVGVEVQVSFSSSYANGQLESFLCANTIQQSAGDSSNGIPRLFAFRLLFNQLSMEIAHRDCWLSAHKE